MGEQGQYMTRYFIKKLCYTTCIKLRIYWTQVFHFNCFKTFYLFLWLRTLQTYEV